MTFENIVFDLYYIKHDYFLWMSFQSKVINSYHHSIPIYPNGRKLTDDIMDTQLAVLTNGRVTTDKVGPHQDLSTVFPYLGSAHPTPQ